MPKMLLNYFVSYNELIRQQRDSGYLAHQLLYQEATASFANTSTSINAFPAKYSEILNLCQCVSLVAVEMVQVRQLCVAQTRLSGRLDQ